MTSLPLEGYDYYLRYAELPTHIYAMTLSNGDGTYSMYLDPRRDPESQLDDWEHELWHIIRDDFYSDKPIEEIENL